MKVPNLNKCCFCIPLRPGIIVFGYLNIVLSFLATAYLVILTEVKVNRNKDEEVSMETVVATVLFSISGMSVILNVLLLVAAYQKDLPMLRLYNYYTIVTILASLLAIIILLAKQQFPEVSVDILAIALQSYVAILVRSEVVKLEQKYAEEFVEENEAYTECIDVPLEETLI